MAPFMLCSMFGNKSLDPRVAHQIKGPSSLNAVNLNHFYFVDKCVQSRVMTAGGVIVDNLLFAMEFHFLCVFIS